jgi:hypothetical protein
LPFDDSFAGAGETVTVLLTNDAAFRRPPHAPFSRSRSMLMPTLDDTLQERQLAMPAFGPLVETLPPRMEDDDEDVGDDGDDDFDDEDDDFDEDFDDDDLDDDDFDDDDLDDEDLDDEDDFDDDDDDDFEDDFDDEDDEEEF